MKRLLLLPALLLFAAVSNDVSTLTVRSIDPVNGTTIGLQTSVHAEFDYSIAAYDPDDEYFIIPLIEKGTGYVGSPDYQKSAPRLHGPAGQAVLDSTLEKLIIGNHGTKNVRVVFSIQAIGKDGHRRGVALSNPTDFTVVQ